MSAPQLTDPGTSTEWFRGVGQTPGGAARSPSQAQLVVNARRQHFTRIVTYTMAGLVGFTLLGLACFAWRHHSMQAELAAAPPAPPVAVAAPVHTLSPAANVDAPAPPAPVAAPAPVKPKPLLIRRLAKPATRSTLSTKTTKLSAPAAGKLSTSRR